MVPRWNIRVQGELDVQIAEHFYTLTEAADYLRVERHTVWRWIRSGKIKAQKVGGVVFIERTVVEDMKPASQLGTDSNEP